MQIRTILMAGTAAGLSFGMAASALAAKPSTTTTTQTTTETANAAQVDDLERQIQSMETQLQYMKRQMELMQTKYPPNAKPAPKVTESGTHKFALESADGQYSIALTGRVHFDVGDYFNFKPDNKFGPIAGAAGELSSGVNVRRARIGVTGKAAGDFTYQFIYDGGNSQDTTAAGIEWAQIAYVGLHNTAFEIGISEPLFTLDTATSSNDIMFIERSSPGNVATSLNTGDFRSNIGVKYMDDRFWLGAYFTGPKASSDSHTLTAERIGAFQRATYQVLQDPNYSLHVGFGIDELIKAPNSGVGTAYTVTLSDQPELRIDPTSFVSTGALGTATHAVTGGTIYDAELAGGVGSLYAQGEYFHYNIDRQGLTSGSFDGGYGEVSYTLTGESRKYNKASGAYGPIVPDHSLSPTEGYWGAWEIAARVSYIDLTSNFTAGVASALQPNAVDGGKQTNFTLGLNWYPNTYMRFMLNYVHTDFEKQALSASTGIPIGSPIGATIDAIAMRSQFAF